MVWKFICRPAHKPPASLEKGFRWFPSKLTEPMNTARLDHKAVAYIGMSVCATIVAAKVPESKWDAFRLVASILGGAFTAYRAYTSQPPSGSQSPVASLTSAPRSE